MPSKPISFRLSEKRQQILEDLLQRYHIEGSNTNDKMNKLLIAIWEKTEAQAPSQDSVEPHSIAPETPSDKVFSPSTSEEPELPSCPYMAYIKDSKTVECARDFKKKGGKIYKVSLQSCIQCDKRRQFVKQRLQQRREENEDFHKTPLEAPPTDLPLSMKYPKLKCPRTGLNVDVIDVCLTTCHVMATCPVFESNWKNPEWRNEIRQIQQARTK